MSPRPYNLGRRQESAEQTRTRIVEAARELLMASDGFSGFTMEAVARQAGVARMTVYYQFESKVGLLEAVSDELARRGHMERLAEAFTQPTAPLALEKFVETFDTLAGPDQTPEDVAPQVMALARVILGVVVD